MDGGESSQSVPSTILDVRQEPAQLLRSGRVAMKEIHREVEVRDLSPDIRSALRSILLVCTGNTCRSAMAESLLEKMLQEEDSGHIDVLQSRLAKIGTTCAEFTLS